MSYYYLSNPYNGTEEQKEERAHRAAIICGQLVKKGIYVWSPIVHNHAMLKIFNQFTLDERRAQILPFDFSLLRKSEGMIVAKMEGWEQSFGVRAEIDLCIELGIPIYYLELNEVHESMDVASIVNALNGRLCQIEDTP